jgi:hypothetical protein
LGEPWEATYEALFLTEAEFAGLKSGEAVHRTDEEPDDKAWKYCEGLKAGFQVWQRIDGTESKRHVDIRWLFPSESRARRYHRLSVARNSEKMPPAPERVEIGDGTLAFTGTDPMGMGLKMHIILFSVGPVVAKVFASGVEFSDGVALARRAEAWIHEALEKLPMPPPPEEPPRNSERWPRGEVEYETKLAGKTLVPGVGVEGVLTFKDTTKTMYDVIGGGDERPSQLFAYHFERGSFGFTVQGLYDRPTRLFKIVRMTYHDDPYRQMRTAEGITMFTTEAEVRERMGAPDTPPKPREGWLWYKRGVAFNIAAGRVAAIELFPAPA